MSALAVPWEELTDDQKQELFKVHSQLQMLLGLAISRGAHKLTIEQDRDVKLFDHEGGEIDWKLDTPKSTLKTLMVVWHNHNMIEHIKRYGGVSNPHSGFPQEGAFILSVKAHDARETVGVIFRSEPDMKEDREAIHATLRLKPWVSKSWATLLFGMAPFAMFGGGIFLWWLMPMWWAAIVTLPLYAGLKRLLPKEGSTFYRQRTRWGLIGRTVLLYGMAFSGGVLMGNYIFHSITWEFYLASGMMLVSLLFQFRWARRRISERKDSK